MDAQVLQQKLTEAGIAVAPGGLDTAVRAFQQAHGLKPDGVVGPLTQAALMSPPSTSTSCTAPGWRLDWSLVRPDLLPVMQAAVADLGVREIPAGSNRGPRVDQILAAANRNALCALRIEGNHCPSCDGQPGPQRLCKGCAWCAASVSEWYSQRAGGSPFGRVLSTRALLAWGQGKGAIVTDPRPADAWFIPTSPGHGHVGLVALVAGDAIHTVEGNSGDAVWGRVRQRGTIGAFIRPVA